MSQEVRGALESQEGPEKRSQEGLDRELDMINSYARLLFIIIIVYAGFLEMEVMKAVMEAMEV